MIACIRCESIFDGDRSAARRSGWEPWSTRDQRAIDHGPMACNRCVGQIIALTLEAIRANLGTSGDVGR